MNKRARESRKLLLGDLVRIKNQNHTLGIVTQECYIDRDIMHPLPGVEVALAVKVQWLDKEAGSDKRREERVYYEKVLELLERGNG